MAKKTDGPLKAYKVEDPFDDEGRGLLVHAHTRAEAKAAAQGELDAEYTSLRATREKAFDDLGGDDLVRALLAAGWWMGCMGCMEHVRSEEEEGEVYDEGHRAAPYVLRNGDVYCSSKCCLKWLRKQRAERVAIWTAMETTVAKWPGVEILHVWNSIGGVSVHFRFPGGEYLVGWTIGDDEVSVLQGDVEAWEQFVAPLRASRAS